MNATATNMHLAESWANSVRAAVPGAGPEWLLALRKGAAQEFLNNGLPGNKDEAWKYTSLQRLEDLHPSLDNGAVREPHPAWPPAVLATAGFGLHVHDGRVAGLEGQLPPGVTLLRLDQVFAQQESPMSGRMRSLLESVDIRGRARSFEALNTAMLEHGALLHVAAGVEAGQFLVQWAHGGPGPSRMHNFRLVLMLEPGARLGLVEHYRGQVQETFSAAHALSVVLQIDLAAGADLHHVMVQDDSMHNVLLTSGEVIQSERSSYQFSGFDLGGGLVRHAITCRLAGQGANAMLNGAFLAEGSRHVDYHVCVDHQAPGCSSDQFFRGVLGGHSRGVFNGKALIRRGADGSKVRQSSANLLLSAFAEIDTKPELEIYADEVEASHGATVGQLDEQAVFYLRSRGLDEAAARGMLTLAFCRTVTARLGDANMAEQINQMLEAAMPQTATLQTAAQQTDAARTEAQ